MPSQIAGTYGSSNLINEPTLQARRQMQSTSMTSGLYFIHHLMLTSEATRVERLEASKVNCCSFLYRHLVC
jgi:hypothetical protein